MCELKPAKVERLTASRDLVEALRNGAQEHENPDHVMTAAADELERLERIIAKLTA